MAKASRGGGPGRFDPRFSPEFQPGFDARVHREEPQVVSRDAAPGPVAGSLITRPVRRAQDASTEPADSGSDRADAASAPGTVAAAHPAVESIATEDEPPAWWRRLNPFLVTLGVVGVAIISFAVGWMVWVYSLANSQFSTQFDYLIVQFAMFGAPVLLSVGVATLVSILVILALRYRR